MSHTRKSIAMLILSVASLLAFAISASAQSSGSGTLRPGSTRCFDSAQLAAYKVPVTHFF